MDESARSLNTLASASEIVLPEVLRPTAVQHAILADLGRRVEACGPCPGDLDTESALKELLGGSDHEYHMKAQAASGEL